MKSPGERGLTAQRLRDVRLAAGFTNQEAAAAHVRDRTRVVGLTNSQWASYESGDPRRPFQQKHREVSASVRPDQSPQSASETASCRAYRKSAPANNALATASPPAPSRRTLSARRPRERFGASCVNGMSQARGGYPDCNVPATIIGGG